MIVRMTQHQIDNAKIFLQRSELKGSEVPAFFEVMQALMKAEKEQPQTEIVTQEV